jgi:hypothetical protein
MDNKLYEININDENYKKCVALKSAGITVSNHLSGNKTIYDVTIDGVSDSDRYFETSFTSLTDIIFAFADKLKANMIKVVA